MGHEVSRLTHVHMAMVELALAGATVSEIASAMGRTPQSVSLIVRSPHFQNELARRRKEQQITIDHQASGTINRAKTLIEENALRAAETLRGLMETSKDVRLQKDCAVEILKRSFDRKYGQIGVDGQPVLSLNLQPGALLNLQIALKESSQLGQPSDLVEQANPLLHTPQPEPLLAPDQTDQLELFGASSPTEGRSCVSAQGSVDTNAIMGKLSEELLENFIKAHAKPTSSPTLIPPTAFTNSYEPEAA